MMVATIATQVAQPATMPVFYEQKQHMVDTPIAMDDDLLLRTMQTIYPDLASGAVSRTRRGGVETITLVKGGAGSKGGIAGVVAELAAAPEARNPMNVFFEQHEEVDLKEMDPEERTLLTLKIDQALEGGDHYHQALEKIHGWLEKAKPMPASSIMLGF